MKENLNQRIRLKKFVDDRGRTSPFACQRCGEQQLRVLHPKQHSVMGETVAVICDHCGIEAWLQVDYMFGPDDRPNVEIVR